MKNNDNNKGLKSPAAVVAAGAKAASWTKRNWKPIAYTTGGIVTVYGLYKLYKFAFPGGLETDPKKEAAKITDTQASTIATRLYHAMWEAGTDEEAIFAALRGLNHNDFIKVSKAFGKKSYVYITGEAPLFGADFLGGDLDLVEWLTQELSVNEIGELKQILPEIF